MRVYTRVVSQATVGVRDNEILSTPRSIVPLFFPELSGAPRRVPFNIQGRRDGLTCTEVCRRRPETRTPCRLYRGPGESRRRVT